MNAEQLNSARLARWSQNGEARLTLEAVAEWLDTIGFCPYLPMNPNGVAAAGSFLEAVVGRPASTPSAGERSRARELMARVVENAAGVPLKLGNSLGEQPDFVASPEVLRYVYALLGNRNFKAGPSTVGNDKVTPLALHCWQAIQEQGPLDVFALQPILSRDITEAAIARALQELWVGLHVIPAASLTGNGAKWDLLSRRFPQQVAAGTNTGQAEAQSAMVSVYLHAVVAATEDEVVAYLSPLAPQSKLREVVRGLGSMRQLDILDIGGRAHVCLQGGLLPEMVAQLSEEQLGVVMKKTNEEVPESSSADHGTITSGTGEDRIEIEREPQRANGDRDDSGKFVPKKFVPKKFVRGTPVPGQSAPRKFVRRDAGAGAPAGKRFGGRSEGASRPRSFAAGAEAASSSKGRGFQRSATDRPGFDAGKPSTRGPGERARRWEKTGEGAGGRTGGDRGFERKPFPTAGRKPSGGRPGGFKPAGSGPAKPWAKRESFGAGDTAGPRERGGEERPKRWEKPAEGAGSGYRKPYAAKSTGYRSARSGPPAAGSKAGGFKPRRFEPGGFQPGGAKPWARRSSEESETGQGERPKRRETGDGSERPRAGGGAGFGARPDKKPWGAKPFGKKPFGKKTFGSKPGGRKPSGFTASGFKSAGTRAAESRSGESKDREAGPSTAKRWVSRGAESRVGSAKSYAARTSRGGESAAPRGPRKTYGKSEGAKPWTERKSSARPGGAADAGDKPKRRERPEPGTGAGDGEKRAAKPAAKPFWAKNPHGGKGSVAASRTNRPRGGKKAGGKKAGGKKGGKKK